MIEEIKKLLKGVEEQIAQEGHTSGIIWEFYAKLQILVKDHKPEPEPEPVKKKIEEFLCEKCKRVFTTERALMTHMRFHNKKPDEKFICNICGREFMFKRGLSKHLGCHIKEEENKEGDFVCSVCGNEYKFSRAFKHHMLTHQEKELNSNPTSDQQAYKDIKYHRGG